MASEERLTVKLLGGSPWGFRLTGGAGTGQPLTVNKIRRKSKAQHQLKEGDLIVAINGVKCQMSTYDEAMNVVDEATDALNIEIIRSKLGKENVAPAAPQQQPQQQQQQPQPQPSQQVKATESTAQRTEAAPLNQKDNYTGGVESATKTFVEDQRLQTTSIHQTSSTQIRQQETKTSQHFEHTQHHQQQQQQQEAVTSSPSSPLKPFFPQVKFPIQSSLDQQHEQQQQQHVSQSIQEQYQQTQFYQEHFKHPQFQQPQKPPHFQSLPPQPPFKHPEIPAPQPPPQEPAQTQFEPPQQQFPPQVSSQQQFAPQVSPQQHMPPQVSPQQQFPPQVSPQQQFPPQVSPQQQPAPSPQPQFSPQPPPPQEQFQPQSPLVPQFQAQFHAPKPQFQAQPEYKPEVQLPLQPPQPSIAPTFNAKAALLSSQLFATPEPFSIPASGEDGGQEKVVSFEQSSDDKHFHQLKTEQTRQKTDNSETRTFLREEQSYVRDGQGTVTGDTEGEGTVDQKPSKPVSSIIQDLEEATRDFHRVADAMSASSVSKSIESTTSSSLFNVTKFESQQASKSESHSIWRPTSPIFNQPLMSPSTLPKPIASHAYQDYKTTNIQGSDGDAPKANLPPKPKASRPVSAPPMDFNITEFAREKGLGGSQLSEMKTTSATTSSTSEFYSSTVSTGAYQPSPEADENETSLLTRRRKMYTSSSFYEEPGAIYPTVEEQVELCRKIADSLSADTNKKSKGANMFYKRVKRSHKWIHESGLDAYSSDGGTTDTELEPPTPDLSAPYIKVSKGPPKLKLIMAPRPIVDMQKLKSQGQQFNEHNVVSPDVCMNIVRDLNSPCGRGAAIFAKRKQKAEEWVVDEEKVKAKTEARKASMQNADLLADIFPPPVTLNPRVKLIKSPWEAAMESPIGSCDAAFVELPPVVGSFMAQSIIQAAEHKLANNLPPEGYDPSTEYHPPGQYKPPEPIYKPVAPVSVDIYRPKAPKGWKGTTQESVPTNRVEPELAPFAPPSFPSEGAAAQRAKIPSSSSSHAPRPVSFHDFNTIPRSWTHAKSSPAQRTASFRPVKPPSTSF